MAEILGISHFVLLRGYQSTVRVCPTDTAVVRSAAAPDYYRYGPWDHMWGGGYGWHFWWMFPMMMLFMVIAFAVIFFLARGFCGHGFRHWGPPSHMMDRSWGDSGYSTIQILNERFARGEIQKDEYTEKKAAILSSGR